MGKAEKVKALLAIKGLKKEDYRKELGLARPQALTNKFGRDSFTLDDIIKLCDLTKTRLCIKDESGKDLIEFDKSDLQPKE